ncbi:MAG: SMC-Scp complex subunit ScpB [Thermodesulfovibrionales bacterium]
MEGQDKKRLVEAVLFLSGEPVAPSELKAATGLQEDEIRDLLEELVSDYAERDGGVVISRIAGGYQMHTNPGCGEMLRMYKGAAKAQKLSLPALETLAIIAYRQPIIKAEIEDLRGVNTDGVLKTLVDRRLVKIVGRKEAPGKPLLYGTTREFLEYFGLKDLSELPTLKDLEREEAA